MDKKKCKLFKGILGDFSFEIILKDQEDPMFLNLEINDLGSTNLS